MYNTYKCHNPNIKTRACIINTNISEIVKDVIHFTNQ